MIDGRVLVVAALVASPAAYRSAQGLLSPGEAMTRYLLVAMGCVVVSMLVRALWPLVAGTGAATPAEAALREAAAGTARSEDRSGGLDTPGDDTDDLEGFGGFSAFDDLEPA